MNMTPFQCYKTYLGIKSHFNSDYDIFKYKGRVSATRESFDKRKDKYRIESLAKKLDDEQIVTYFLANVANSQTWSLFDERSDERYNKYVGYIMSLNRNFENELNQLYMYAVENKVCYDDIFFNKETHPLIFTEYMAKNISIQTMTIIDHINSFVDRLDKNIVTEKIIFLVKKYKPFMKIEDIGRFTDIERAVRERHYCQIGE